MNSDSRRQLFIDVYKLAEFYEVPPFQPGDIEGNGNWFIMSYETVIKDFLAKYEGNKLAYDLVSAVIDDASRRAADANKQASVI